MQPLETFPLLIPVEDGILFNTSCLSLNIENVVVYKL